MDEGNRYGLESYDGSGQVKVQVRVPLEWNCLILASYDPSEVCTLGYPSLASGVDALDEAVRPFDVDEEVLQVHSLDLWSAFWAGDHPWPYLEVDHHAFGVS